MRTLVLFAVASMCLVFASTALAQRGATKSLDGTLRTWHGDTWRNGVAFGAGVDTTIAGIVPVRIGKAEAARLAGRKVAAAGGQVSATGGSTVVSATGTKKIAVLLFDFTNDTSQPWTPATVRDVVFDGASSVNVYYQTASYGKLALTGDVFGWYPLADDNTGCRYTTWASEANAAASAAGVNLGNYTNVVYAFPYTSSCGWAGLAYFPGSQSFINGYMQLRVVAHELGHNFGVHHASTLSCTDAGVRVMISSSCSGDEYGDPFTVMGSATSGEHNNWHRAQFGWIPDVQTVSASGTYTLAPAELSGTPRLLRIARGDGTYLNLEFRQPQAPFDTYSATDPVVNGVTVRIAPDFGSLVQSKLLDGTPATTSYWDSALAAGASFLDPVSGVRVTTVSVTPAGASVGVDFGGGPTDTQAPSAPGTLAATPQSSSSIALSWGAATDNVAVTGYRIYRNGAQIATTTSRSYTDTGLAAGTTYGYDVRAFDAAGNVGPASSASATTSTADTTAPTAPTGLAASVGKGRRVDLRWSSATDNVGVTGYRIFRNGVQVAQVTGLSYSDHPGRGSFSYTARAVDAAGNQSAASNVVSVQT